MGNTCNQCGAPLKPDAKFCINCGAKVEQSAPEPRPLDPHPETKPTPPPAQTQPTQPTQPQAQPQMQQTQYLPSTQSKSNRGLLIGIIAIIIAVVVVAVILVFFLSGGGIGGEEGKLVGTWEINMGGFGGMEFSYEMKFSSDKSLSMAAMGSPMTKVGTWKVENGQLILSYDVPGYGSDLPEGKYDYSFSNNGNTLKLKMNGVEVMQLTKK